LSTQEIADQGMLFIVAGFDTTSTTLTNIVYCLANNPECQERLYQEIISVVYQFNTIYPDYDILNELKYLDAVIWESIRYIPAVPRFVIYFLKIQKLVILRLVMRTELNIK
ncbi:Thromboxane-A synthase-like protein, partial [Dinothrombium tinctorium]